MFHGTIIEELINHEEWSHYNENVIHDQKDFVFVKSNGLHLKSMENLQTCISLRVCIFSNNFITDIHPLQSCIKLIKLDLHGNQIKSLPEISFWSGLKNLKLLYLHDNGFVNLKNICVLSACPNLVALTLFDCPVSLKGGYRHVLVNSVLSLKALDRYVISDEEIVQNWQLPERFKICNDRLFFNFCPALRKGTTYEDELNNIKYVISKINEILAHNSPVLIVQRWIRGFLVRKHLSLHFRGLSFCAQLEKAAQWKCLTDRQQLLREEAGEKWERMHPIKSHPEQSALSTRHYHLRIGQETGDEIEDEECDTHFSISAFRLPIYTSSSLKYAAVLNEKKQDLFPPVAQPHPVTHSKPVIKTDALSKRNARRELSARRSDVRKLQARSDIDKYHTEQKKQALLREKQRAVAMAHVVKERANLTILEKLEKKKCISQKLAERHHETIQRGLQRLWQDRFNYLAKVKVRRALFVEEMKQKAADRSVIQNFSNERNFLIKAMLKIEKLEKDENVLREKHMIVQQKLEAEKHQMELHKLMKESR
ncbi:leucine-rich repeat and IQ domain-containing protein 3 [Ctenodactylus gundi]